MQITKAIIKIVDAKGLPEDLKQDVLVALLETEEPDPAISIRAVINRIVNTTRNDQTRVEARRREIETTPHWQDALELVSATNNSYPDPLDILIQEEQAGKVEELSDLLRSTLEQFLDGLTPAQIAEAEGATTNVIYQRLWQIKKIIFGDN